MLFISWNLIEKKCIIGPTYNPPFFFQKAIQANIRLSACPVFYHRNGGYKSCWAFLHVKIYIFNLFSLQNTKQTYLSCQ
jgi:hypothetical protein